MRVITAKSKNLIGGILVMGLGIQTVVGAQNYEVGTISRMGPGYFPTAIGGILALSGLAIAGAAVVSADGRPPQPVQPEWRGWACIILGVVAFVVFGGSLGLLPATFAVVFVSALGDRQNSLRDALLLSLGMVAVSLVVFWWGLKIHMPLFAWSWQ
jgi:hypothetical protein